MQVISKCDLNKGGQEACGYLGKYFRQNIPKPRSCARGPRKTTTFLLENTEIPHMI